MNPKQLATDFYGMAEAAAMNIMDIFAQEDCKYVMDHSHNRHGISIHFMFRGELDFSLLVPWEYVKDDILIRDYYIRFKNYSKEAITICDVDRMADAFSQLELDMIKKA